MDSPSGLASPGAPRRQGLALLLSCIMLAVYAGFIFLVAYQKPLLGTQIVPGLSWGILLGVLVIVCAWLLTFIYVSRVNTD